MVEPSKIRCLSQNAVHKREYDAIPYCGLKSTQVKHLFTWMLGLKARKLKLQSLLSVFGIHSTGYV